MDDESVCFFDQNFIASHPLTAQNIIEYFSTSQFYDKSCLNEILKMQSQFASIDISHKITQVVGFYYALEKQTGELFVIAKKENNGNVTRTLKMYYCVFGYLYCCPTLKSVSEAREIDALMFLNTAIDKYVKRRTTHWLTGVKYKKEVENESVEQSEVKFLYEVLHDFEARKNNKF